MGSNRVAGDLQAFGHLWLVSPAATTPRPQFGRRERLPALIRPTADAAGAPAQTERPHPGGRARMSRAAPRRPSRPIASVEQQTRFLHPPVGAELRRCVPPTQAPARAVAGWSWRRPRPREPGVVASSSILRDRRAAAAAAGSPRRSDERGRASRMPPRPRGDHRPRAPCGRHPGRSCRGGPRAPRRRSHRTSRRTRGARRAPRRSRRTRRCACKQHPVRERLGDRALRAAPRPLPSSRPQLEIVAVKRVQSSRRRDRGESLTGPDGVGDLPRGLVVGDRLVPLTGAVVERGERVVEEGEVPHRPDRLADPAAAVQILYALGEAVAGRRRPAATST